MNLYPDDFAKRLDVQVSGDCGRVDMNQLPDALIERIAAGEETGAIRSSVSKDVARGYLHAAPEDGEEIPEAPWEAQEEDAEWRTWKYQRASAT